MKNSNWDGGGRDGFKTANLCQAAPRVPPIKNEC